LKIWNEMISCDDAGFEELHRELRSCPGLYILDNVRMPETFGNCISSIEIRHYSPRVITLTCNPPPREYTGKDRKIRSWAQLGTAKFSSFAEISSSVNTPCAQINCVTAGFPQSVRAAAISFLSQYEKPRRAVLEKYVLKIITVFNISLCAGVCNQTLYRLWGYVIIFLN